MSPKQVFIDTGQKQGYWMRYEVADGVRKRYHCSKEAYYLCFKFDCAKNKGHSNRPNYTSYCFENGAKLRGNQEPLLLESAANGAISLNTHTHTLVSTLPSLACPSSSRSIDQPAIRLQNDHITLSTHTPTHIYPLEHSYNL